MIIGLMLTLNSACSFALCGTNEPMCDVNMQVQPVFLQDDFRSRRSNFGIVFANPANLQTFMKKNVPYTVRCLISFKDFVDGIDQEQFDLHGWMGVDTSNITFVEGNNSETTTPVPSNIILHHENGNIYFKHLVITGNQAEVGLGYFQHNAHYDCVAYEEFRHN